MTEYRVALDSYNGPLDMLLFLIQREDVAIHDIPIARITEQYLSYLAILTRIDPEAVGDFLVLAATLMEIKSRSLLPTLPPDDPDSDGPADPRLELVRQLLAYKTFKDAARSLEHAAGEQALGYPRQPVMPEPPIDEFELDNLEVWHLFEAFKKLLDQTGRLGAAHRIQQDDTPLALYATDLVDSLQRAGGREIFEEVFRGRTVAEMIGLFLALLELIRQRRVRASQDGPLSPILLFLIDPTPLDELPALNEQDLDQIETAMATAPADEIGAVSAEPPDNDMGIDMPEAPDVNWAIEGMERSDVYMDSHNEP